MHFQTFSVDWLVSQSCIFTCTASYAISIYTSRPLACPLLLIVDVQRVPRELSFFWFSIHTMGNSVLEWISRGGLFRETVILLYDHWSLRRVTF